MMISVPPCWQLLCIHILYFLIDVIMQIKLFFKKRSDKSVKIKHPLLLQIIIPDKTLNGVLKGLIFVLVNQPKKLKIRFN